MAKKTIDKATVEALKAKFKEAPKLELAEELTPVEAVIAMAKEIREMQDKGYTLATILEDLKSGGIEVGLSTLKKAIKDAEAKEEAKTVNRRPRSPRANKKEVQQDLLETATTEAPKEMAQPTAKSTTEAGSKFFPPSDDLSM